MNTPECISLTFLRFGTHVICGILDVNGDPTEPRQEYPRMHHTYFIRSRTHVICGV